MSISELQRVIWELLVRAEHYGLDTEPARIALEELADIRRCGAFDEESFDKMVKENEIELT